MTVPCSEYCRRVTRQTHSRLRRPVLCVLLKSMLQPRSRRQKLASKTKTAKPAHEQKTGMPEKSKTAANRNSKIVSASTRCIYCGLFFIAPSTTVLCWCLPHGVQWQLPCNHTRHLANIPRSRTQYLDSRDNRDLYYASSKNPYAGPETEDTNGEQVQSHSAGPTAEN